MAKKKTSSKADQQAHFEKALFSSIRLLADHVDNLITLIDNLNLRVSNVENRVFGSHVSLQDKPNDSAAEKDHTESCCAHRNSIC